jgi:tetratricopeptide (TPR) repeat protein
MRTTVNWLHLSDIHLGLKGQGWLWPKLKQDFYDDLRRLASRVGPWDLVLFTGDITQRGAKEEYESATRELDELWKLFADLRCAPVFVAVPGNHDLVRPDSSSPVPRALKQWHHDQELRNLFWGAEEGEYRQAISSYFQNYTDWWQSLRLPRPPNFVSGTLPGDFSCILEKGGIRVGIVGLNSSFLQIGPGECEGQLDMHVSQLHAVCDDNPVTWVRGTDLSLLLTHHSPNWLSKTGAEHFSSEVYPPGRFFAHLCGHQHQPRLLDVSEGGSAIRRLRQAPSLFGLEFWGEQKKELRIHGFNAGQITIDEHRSFERVWPRQAIKGLSGTLRLRPDHRYDLDEDDSVRTEFNAKTPGSGRTSAEIDSDASLVLKTPQPGPAPDVKAPVELKLLEQPPDQTVAEERLSAVPRFRLIPAPQHRLVRQDEQAHLEHGLRRNRCVWLVSDWGTGRDEFLSAALERFAQGGTVPDVFHIRCEEADDIDALQLLFPQQTGLPLQPFCSYLAALKSRFLLLDGLQPGVVSQDNIQRLLHLVSAVLDYCPDLKIILLVRTPVSDKRFDGVELKPLEAPDVRAYVVHHPDSTPDLHDADVIDRLHQRSGGLPKHLDRMLRSLRVSSLNSVLEAEFDVDARTAGGAEPVPKALVGAVGALGNSADRGSQRSLRLLKLLSVLPYGETIEALNHYFPTEPFFISHALRLDELALLETIPLQSSAPRIQTGDPARARTDASAPKLLKVPRQVRDYVLSLLSESERREIVSAGAELFFGRRWREGKVKLRTTPIEYREYLEHTPGNEFAVLHYLLSDSRQRGDKQLARRAVRLGLQYGRKLIAQDRFRDLVFVTRGLIELVDRASLPEEWAELAALCGYALRMTSKSEEAIKFLEWALECGKDSLQKDALASIQLDLALAHRVLKDKESALSAAEAVKGLAPPNSGPYLQAVAVTESLTKEGADLVDSLKGLEKSARDTGFEVIANNIAIELERETDDLGESTKLLDRVVATSNDEYNGVRAVIVKAELLLGCNKANELTPADRKLLSYAYSYLYSQRFGNLFDRCHDAVWQLLVSSNDMQQLLRVFRHSSFVWRVRGETEREVKYASQLADRKPESAPAQVGANFALELLYFMKRMTGLALGLNKNS